MAESDYLKKLKESLEQGVKNDDVVNLHFDILKGADLEIKLRQDKLKDIDSYTKEILNYATDKNDILGNELKKIEIEHASYTNEVKNYIGESMPKEIINKLTDQSKGLADFEADRIKKERIELNTHQIRLLNEDSQKLRAKIQKNDDLILYLMEEIKRFS